MGLYKFGRINLGFISTNFANLRWSVMVRATQRLSNFSTTLDYLSHHCLNTDLQNLHLYLPLNLKLLVFLLLKSASKTKLVGFWALTGISSLLFPLDVACEVQSSRRDQGATARFHVAANTAKVRCFKAGWFMNMFYIGAPWMDHLHKGWHLFLNLLLLFWNCFSYLPSALVSCFWRH